MFSKCGSTWYDKQLFKIITFRKSVYRLVCNSLRCKESSASRGMKKIISRVSCMQFIIWKYACDTINERSCAHDSSELLTGQKHTHVNRTLCYVNIVDENEEGLFSSILPSVRFIVIMKSWIWKVLLLWYKGVSKRVHKWRLKFK